MSCAEGKHGKDKTFMQSPAVMCKLFHFYTITRPDHLLDNLPLPTLIGLSVHVGQSHGADKKKAQGHGGI